ncbi:hypothetical protein ACFVH6_00545 [Spirillospora sp. NPDC127200]
MRSFSARLAATAVAFVALAPVSAVHAAPAPATLKDVPLPFLWPKAGVYGVAAVSDTEAWIAGHQGQIGNNRGNPVVRRRMGSQWKEYPLNGWSGNGSISKVVAHGGEVWAWGVQGEERLYLARFDGTAFQPVAAPPGVAYAYHTRLWAGPAGVWVQITVNRGDDVLRAALFRRVGGTWKADPVVDRLQGDGLTDMQARSATEVWAGGCRHNPTTQSLESVTLRWNGSTWTTLPPLPTEGCNTSVAPAGGGTVWSLTWNAALHHWNGTKWTAAPANSFVRNGGKVRLDKDGNPLVSISDAPIYGPGPLLRYVNGTWQTFSTPVETWTGDVSVAPSGRIWVAGSTRVNSPLLLTSP